MDIANPSCNMHGYMLRKTGTGTKQPVFSDKWWDLGCAGILSWITILHSILSPCRCVGLRHEEHTKEKEQEESKSLFQPLFAQIPGPLHTKARELGLY